MNGAIPWSAKSWSAIKKITLGGYSAMANANNMVRGQGLAS